MNLDFYATDDLESVAQHESAKGAAAAASPTGPASSSVDSADDPEVHPSNLEPANTSASGLNYTPTVDDIGEQSTRQPHFAVLKTPDSDDMTTDHDTKRPASPQHDDVDPPNAYYRDIDFKVAQQSERNKRVLLSRLCEAAPRGRLSLINLCRRGIGIPEAAMLREAIIANPQLYVLKLSYNNLGEEGATIIASAILQVGKRRHHQLCVLDLGFNSVGDIGCGALAVHCIAGNFNLQTLCLSGNQFTERGALSIAGAILHGTGLRDLLLSVNHVGPMGMKAIAGAIAKNEARMTQAVVSGELDGSSVRRMEELHLGSTAITSEGFIAIPSMLLSNSSLRSISLSDNNLDDQDIFLLSQSLTQNKLVPLESLMLSFNQITCQGVECLMNAIWGSATLRVLKLDNNNIKDRGTQLCAVALTSIALETLDLSFNKMSATGMKALMKNLTENTSLLSLSLAGIPIDQNASKAVSYALAYNTSLRVLYLDSCSTGYASQRHILAGVVSNRKTSLRVLTGFGLSGIAMTLGMPRLPEAWSNDQVLGFFRLMWQQWLLKSRNGSPETENVLRGPAPPAAVAAAAKIAFTALGSSPEHLFQTEPHEKPMAERAPVEPVGAALLERSDSGTVSVPLFTVSSEVEIHDFVDGESKLAAMVHNARSRQISTVRGPLENPERRNNNLRWLRLHFGSLSDVGRLPFHNADLWQLHQYYFSPPPDETDDDSSASDATEAGRITCDDSKLPLMTSLCARRSTSPDRTVSFHTLSEALSAHGELPSTHGIKRASMVGPEVAHDGPAAKKSKNLKPRIAYYPRIMAMVQSLGTKPMEQTLSLLRQLKYTESVMFVGRNPYTELRKIESGDLPCHADIDMILLDLL